MCSNISKNCWRVHLSNHPNLKWFYAQMILCENQTRVTAKIFSRKQWDCHASLQILLTKLFKIHNSLFLSTNLEGSYNLKIMQPCYTSVNVTAPLPTARAKGVNKGHVSIHGQFQFVPDQYRLHTSYLVLGFFHLMPFFLSSTMQDKKHQITFLHPLQISCIILLAVCRSANPITECQSSFHPAPR